LNPFGIGIINLNEYKQKSEGLEHEYKKVLIKNKSEGLEYE
jgi:hypothetical protein